MDLPVQIFVNKSLDGASLTTDQTGTSIEIKQVIYIAVHVVWSGGSLTGGTIHVEGSIDGSDFQSVGSQVVSTTSGGYLLNIAGAGYSWLRVRWDQSAGTGGTITAYISGKA